jgi:stage II sporulation protein D
VTRTDKFKIWGTVILSALAVGILVTYIINKNSVQENQKSLSAGTKSVCIYENGEYEIMDAEEYTAFALAGTMDEKWSEEMIKVMAVVVRTGIYYQMENRISVSETDKNLINESNLREVRYTQDELEEMWGQKWENIFNRALVAVADTSGLVMRYAGKAIMPAYHMVSVGKTVSAEELYGVDVAYLKSKDSEVDMLSEDFSTTDIYSGERISNIFENWEQDEDSQVIKVSEATSSGFAKTVTVFGAEIPADIFKERLGLNSTNIHIDQMDGKYRIITVGVGDSIGLSLYGASVLADAGESYRDILEYYYDNIVISK